MSLKSLLPMLGGAAGMMFGIPPWVSAAAIGGLETAATGDISKGLGAGLGAYGGGSLAGGLMGSGAGLGAAEASTAASAAAPGAAAPSITGMAVPAATDTALTTGLESQVIPNMAAGTGEIGGLSSSNSGLQSLMSGNSAPMALDAPATSITGTEAANMSSAADAQAAQNAGAAGQQASTDYMVRTAGPDATYADRAGNMGKGIQGLSSESGRSAFLEGMGGGKEAGKMGLAAIAAPGMMGVGADPYSGPGKPEEYKAMSRKYTLDRSAPDDAYAKDGRKGERRYFKDQWTAQAPTAMASGGNVPSFSEGGGFFGALERRVGEAFQGKGAGSLSDPLMHYLSKGDSDKMFAPLDQTAGDYYETTHGAADRREGQQLANGGGITALAGGGHLGGYSDGGRLLRGPGDGVSDSIPASINGKQPARLADGEFVVPARIVSELGNGSTEAGSRKLYAMMDRVQAQRKKTVGKGKTAVNSRADKHLPA